MSLRTGYAGFQQSRRYAYTLHTRASADKCYGRECKNRHNRFRNAEVRTELETEPLHVRKRHAAQGEPARTVVTIKAIGLTPAPEPPTMETP